MSKKNEDNQEPIHVYDGIEELDNPMPVWWLWSFFFSIMFAGFYFLHYTSGIGPTLTVEYNEANAHHLSRFKNKGGTIAKTMTEEELLAKMASANQNELGAKVYTKSCEACHANHLQGLVGPNLTDEFWIQGQGKPADIYHVIQNGVAEKGMPAWGPQLKDDEILAVVAFIIEKRGSNPNGAKAPQGNSYPDYLKR